MSKLWLDKIFTWYADTNSITDADFEYLSKEVLNLTPSRFVDYSKDLILQINKKDKQTRLKLLLIFLVLLDNKLDIGFIGYNVLQEKAIDIALDLQKQGRLDLGLDKTVSKQQLLQNMQNVCKKVNALSVLSNTENVKSKHILKYILQNTEDIRYLFISVIDEYFRIVKLTNFVRRHLYEIYADDTIEKNEVAVKKELYFRLNRELKRQEYQGVNSIETLILVGEKSVGVFAQLASVLDLTFYIQQTLEDFALLINHPDMYMLIDKAYKKNTVSYENVENIILRIKTSLNSIKQDVLKVYGRVKSKSSVYKKLFKYEKEGKSSDISKITDLMAFRVVTKDLDSALEAIFLLHNYFDVDYADCDDYISHPKPNGYQAYHMQIQLPTLDYSVELQVLDQNMAYTNTYGSASHISYKLSKSRFAPPSTESYEWLRKIHNQILKYRQKVQEEFTLGLKVENLFNDMIFVFTPKGKIISLPKGATALDFAFVIHTEIGASAHYALVNGNKQELSYKLQNNDVVKIITTNRKWPLSEFLDIVTTDFAKDKINSLLKKKIRTYVQKTLSK